MLSTNHAKDEKSLSQVVDSTTSIAVECIFENYTVLSELLKFLVSDLFDVSFSSCTGISSLLFYPRCRQRNSHDLENSSVMHLKEPSILENCGSQAPRNNHTSMIDTFLRIPWTDQNLLFIMKEMKFLTFTKNLHFSISFTSPATNKIFKILERCEYIQDKSSIHLKYEKLKFFYLLLSRSRYRIWASSICLCSRELNINPIDICPKYMYILFPTLRFSEIVRST